MACTESAIDKEGPKPVANGIDGVDLGEHYLVVRNDGTWRKYFAFVLNPVKIRFKLFSVMTV